MRIPGASRVVVLSVVVLLASGCSGGSSGGEQPSPPVGTVGVAPGTAPGTTETPDSTDAGPTTDDATTDEPTPGPAQGGTVDPNDPEGVAQAYGVTLVDPVEAGMVQYSLIGFTSPSKGISCEASDESADGKAYVRCDVAQNTWQKLPPVPADCEFDWGLAVGLDADGRPGHMLCVSDAAGGPVVLGYGKAVLVGPILCMSRTTGVECVVTSGPKHGFKVAKAAYSLY